MRVLVCNLGSTSFKHKLFDIEEGNGAREAVLAEGSADRIGQGDSNWSASNGDKSLSGTMDLDDHKAAVDLQLDALKRLEVIDSVDQIDAVGFKAVHGGPISGAVKVDEHVLKTQEQFADVAPAHNRRYGFHGASHRYIATRMAEIAPEAKRIINLHLGGSCSICAIEDGKSVANSFGMTAQSGVFHNNRVGDFDTFALLKLQAAGIDTDEAFRRLGKEGGLLGISGVSADMREVEEAADKGNERAQLAVDAFIETCRHYVGAYLVALGGADAITFTGGIGQHGDAVREKICAGLDFAGIKLDPQKNKQASGKDENRIESDNSSAQVWVLPTNEELIVARQTVEVLRSS